jgi:hypothetical protein
LFDEYLHPMFLIDVEPAAYNDNGDENEGDVQDESDVADDFSGEDEDGGYTISFQRSATPLCEIETSIGEISERLHGLLSNGTGT